jgi:hypothetical protein
MIYPTLSDVLYSTMSTLYSITYVHRTILELENARVIEELSQRVVGGGSQIIWINANIHT